MGVAQNRVPPILMVDHHFFLLKWLSWGHPILRHSHIRAIMKHQYGMVQIVMGHKPAPFSDGNLTVAMGVAVAVVNR